MFHKKGQNVDNIASNFAGEQLKTTKNGDIFENS